MAKDRDHWDDRLTDDTSGGWLTHFLADEDELDRRSMWRLGSWGVGSVGAVIVAILASQSSTGARREQVAAADLTRQSQQIQWVAKESQNEARRLASAIETLNADRDRLYSRVSGLEQNLDSVTGAISRQVASIPATPPSTPSAPQPAPTQIAAAPPGITAPATVAAPKPVGEKTPEPAPLPPIAAAPPVSSKPPTESVTTITPAPPPLMAAKSFMAPPDPSATKLTEIPPTDQPAAPVVAPEIVASNQSAPMPNSAVNQTPDIALQRTEFGIDLGSANSIEELRTLWQRLLKSNATLATLRPIVALKERNSGRGMQLRLIAGPLSDAAAAAKICAALSGNDRPCETSVFDGQRLAMTADRAPVPKRVARRRSSARVERAVKPAEPAPPKTSSLTSFLGPR